MKGFKKAFTIVELVIVIAVIAILAAVLIPTFSNIIRKANISNDTQLVRNLNTALVVDKAINGEHKTMQSALDAAFDAGYDLSKINARANQNEILWDSVNDVFCYYNADKEEGHRIEYIPEFPGQKKAEDYDYWKIYTVYEGEKGFKDSQKYSVYYDGADLESVTMTVGFDAGKSNVAEVNYTRTSGDPQNVVIRTNGGTLTVDAADTVNHYGDVSILNIEEVATSSYHEYGTVAHAQIKKGRIVIERSEASIDHLLLIAKENKSGFEDIVVETKTGAELPTFDRTDVIISEKGTLVLNVVTPTSNEYIYLTKAGVIEQIVVTNEVKEDVSSETANVASKSETTQAVAEQVANVGTKDASGNYVDVNNEIVIYADGTVAEGKDASSIATEAKADDTAVQTGLTKFAGGAGTKQSPYLISCQEHFNNIAIFNNEMYNCNEYYFAQIADITLDGSKENQPNDFTGNFVGEYNGNGYSIYMVNTADAASAHRATLFGDLDGTRTKIHNFTLYVEEYDTNIFSINWGNNTVIENITIENNKNYTVTKGVYNNYGLVCVHNRGSIAFKNITNNANVDFGNWYSAVIMGGYSNKNTGMIFDNCVNNGYISGSDVGFLIGNYTYNNSMVFEDNQDSMNTLDSNKVKIYINDCKNNNVIFGTSGADIICQTNGNNHNNLSSDSLEYVYSNCLKGTIVNGSQIPIALGISNNNIYISTTVSNASYYLISAKTAVSYKEGGSGWVTIKYDNISKDDSIIFIKYIMSEDRYESEYGKTYDSVAADENYDVNSNRYKIVEENGINIVVVKTLDSNKGISSFKNEVTYDVFAYDDTNKLITGNTFKASDLCQ